LQQLKLIDYPVKDIDTARTEVTRHAQELLALGRRDDPRWDPPPYDPEHLARALGIRIVQELGEVDFDAMLLPYGDLTTIVVNGKRAERRKKFSLAHELSHLWFSNAHETTQWRTEDKQAYDASRDAQALERLCDQGAAELLMPYEAFTRVLMDEGFEASSLPTLADHFEVSYQAAAVRMAELHHGNPCAVGLFRWGTRRDGSAPGYRVDRVFTSRGFPFLFPRNKSVPPESCIYQASLQWNQLTAVEPFELRDTQATAHVTAWPLHRNVNIDQPPTVCAALELVEQL